MAEPAAAAPCTGLLLENGWQFRLCGKPSVAVYSFGCVHEHIRPDMPICEEHENRSTNAGCQTCFQAGHECPMIAHLVRRLDGADAAG